MTQQEILELANGKIYKAKKFADQYGLLTEALILLDQLKPEVCPACKGSQEQEWRLACDGKGDYRSWAEKQIAEQQALIEKLASEGEEI